MLAVIHRAPEGPSRDLPVAGRPLLVRQLQWLRAVGAKQVVVELRPSDGRQEIADLAISEIGVGLKMKFVSSVRPMSVSLDSLSG